MADTEKLLKAMECSLRPYREKDDCKECKYRFLEKVDGRIPCPPDCEENGIKYWESCDCDGMVRDAIQTIKELQEQNKALMLLLKWSEECDFGLDSFPEEYEKYKDRLTEDMSYTDMMIEVAKCCVRELPKFEEE